MFERCNSRTITHLNFAIAAGLLFASLSARADSALISITGIKPEAVQFSIDDLKQLPTRHAQVVSEDGKPADYECVAAGAVLQKAGAAMGTEIRGKRLADYLLVTAADGYRAVFALPELDPEFTDRAVLLCFARDGAPVSTAEGPLRLVVPQEKRHARWMRQVKEFALRTDR